MLPWNVQKNNLKFSILSYIQIVSILSRISYILDVVTQAARIKVIVSMFISWLHNLILLQYFWKHEDSCMKRWNLWANLWLLRNRRQIQSMMQHCWHSFDGDHIEMIRGSSHVYLTEEAKKPQRLEDRSQVYMVRYTSSKSKWILQMQQSISIRKIEEYGSL